MRCRRSWRSLSARGLSNATVDSPPVKSAALESRSPPKPKIQKEPNSGTSPSVQIKELWGEVDELLDMEPIELEGKALTLQPVEEQ